MVELQERAPPGLTKTLQRENHARPPGDGKRTCQSVGAMGVQFHKFKTKIETKGILKKVLNKCTIYSLKNMLYLIRRVLFNQYSPIDNISERSCSIFHDAIARAKTNSARKLNSSECDWHLSP
jgi:hypothetical protein